MGRSLIQDSLQQSQFGGRGDASSNRNDVLASCDQQSSMITKGEEREAHNRSKLILASWIYNCAQCMVKPAKRHAVCAEAQQLSIDTIKLPGSSSRAHRAGATHNIHSTYMYNDNI